MNNLDGKEAIIANGSYRVPIVCNGKRINIDVTVESVSEDDAVLVLKGKTYVLTMSDIKEFYGFLKSSISKYRKSVLNSKEPIKTQIRCYRTTCKHNTNHKANCGFCNCKEVVFTSEGCMEYKK